MGAQNGVENGIENGIKPTNNTNTTETNDYKLRTFQSVLNLLAHIFIGITVGTTLLWVFRNGLPTTSTPVHVTLCILGYHLLMAEAILSLTSHNGWTIHLRLVDKRRAHWILQIMGSALAIAGSFVKILDKSSHWTTYHGQFALVALVFTTMSLVNGLASLWAYEVRRFLPMKLSKVTHICFGTIAFVASSICLCYGFEKNSFMNWTGQPMGYTLIGITAAYTTIIIVNPLITFANRIRS